MIKPDDRNERFKKVYRKREKDLKSLYYTTKHINDDLLDKLDKIQCILILMLGIGVFFGVVSIVNLMLMMR